MDSPNSGYLEINELSDDKKIVKGNFKCTLFNEFDFKDSIKITDGKFYININTLKYPY
jgi:hypothetical protein